MRNNQESRVEAIVGVFEIVKTNPALANAAVDVLGMLADPCTAIEFWCRAI